MRYIKTYEQIYRKPKIGDHAIVEDKNTGNKKIGEIVGMWDNGKLDILEYDKTPSISGGSHFTNVKYVEYWSDTKDELEMMVQINKYNL